MLCKICTQETKVMGKKNQCFIYHCSNCDFYFSDASTPPEDYDERIWEGTDKGWRKRNTEKDFERHLTMAQIYNPQISRALDFGCGFGLFVNWLRRQSINAYGCDSFPEIRKEGNFSKDYTKWNNIYDAIFMVEVLEHLKEPLQTLAKFQAHSHKRTVLYIQTQILNPKEDLFPWWYCDPPVHCNYFTPQAIKEILKLSGWKTLYQKNPTTIAQRGK